ncbi:beta/alpha barrel domain-containing protein [Hymenobacter lapidiphilus]|uniref:Bifunctional 4-hydroxy-2-oxoglutarate aldolase/2-dehydro-3-deoxy-phosphogluconate aldolase n=1 Tax=Hymenobacter lapidiphilus TaxID=2608003 RepID=A0A7Y7PQ93_9BACT|nr:bifunctional 4-hydroxy-2-oxoglutarate aldolase/2-dehydro-3-deoxy-phosphogluconate aldolase [Hymenobacter lapidiphilus]NVO31852.1 bifunctional 4-hydroxy-2-oxoglutarate aldolase/2-dehydro-3-deoxy-phosphogluconate aldolase [Hymenobacter lapidiphilus]
MSPPKNLPSVAAPEALARMLQAPLVPVFYHADIEHAKQIVQACYAGGVRVFEFTNRGDNALPVFRQLREFARHECPELLLGIGTVYDAKTAEAFIAAGSDFVVQPVTTADVAATCQHHDVAWVPGVLTPNEIFQAIQLGAELVKIFPGNLVGPDYVKAIHGPMPQMKIMVTGGVEPTLESLTAWFAGGVSCVGIGSQLFKNSADPAALTARVAGLISFIHSLKR